MKHMPIFDLKFQKKYLSVCKKIAPKEEMPSFQQRFEKQLKEMNIPGTDAYKRAEEVANIIINNIENGNHFIGL